MGTCSARPAMFQAIPSVNTPMKTLRAHSCRNNSPIDEAKVSMLTASTATKNATICFIMKTAKAGEPGGAGACIACDISGVLNTVMIMTHCRIPMRVPKPDSAMKIHASTVTKLDF